MKFSIGEQAIINKNALIGLPDNIGYIVTISEIFNQNYDYQVRFPDGTYTKVKENELDKIKTETNLKIALLGKMRSGKDTIAEYAINKYEFTKYAFGDELKRCYHELFGHTETKPREGYQWLGQTMRQRDTDIWVRKCFENIYNGNDKRIIITDLRQPNEYEKSKSEGFVLIKVQANDELRLKRILESNDNFKKEDLYHETEMYIDGFKCDYIINNDGSLEELYKQFDEIMSKIN